MIAGLLKSIDNFNYVTSTVITPTFLVAGTFFPLSGLPEWAQIARQLQPAAPHGRARPPRRVRLGGLGADSWHLGALVLFALVMWRLAIRAMERKLIT